jgi:hypothetical protein
MVDPSSMTERELSTTIVEEHLLSVAERDSALVLESQHIGGLLVLSVRTATLC